MSDREELRQLLVDRAVKLDEGVDPDGKKNHWLVDCREVLLVPRGAHLISKLFYEKLKDFKSRQVGGLTIAANPIVSFMTLLAYQDKRPVSGFIIRKKPKYNGLRKLIEGDFKSGESTIIVDDLINSGGSIFRAIRNVEENGCTVEGVICIVSFGNKGVKELNEKGYRTEYLYTLEELFLRNPKEKIRKAEIVWTHECNDNWAELVPRSSPVRYKDTIMFGTTEGIFYCLGLDGKVRWKLDCGTTNIKGILSSPTIYRDKVYFGAYNGYLYCLNPVDGTVIWKKQRGDWIGSSPSIKNNILYIGIEYGSRPGLGVFMACSAETGKLLWHIKTNHYIHSSPQVGDGIAIIGCNDNYVYTADAKDGKLKWKHHIGKETKAGFVIDSGSVYFGSHDGHIRSMDIETGEINWKKRVGTWVYSTPEIVGDNLVFSAVSARIIVLDKNTGSVKWFYNTEKKIMSYTYTSEDRVYCGSADGHLYILNLKTGNLIEKINVGMPILTKPLVFDDKIYLGCKGAFICVK